jgi:hypothetical protein
MLNQIQNHLAQIDFWYWFALGAASLLKLILWTKLPWWRFALLLAVYELLTLAALQGGRGRLSCRYVDPRRRIHISLASFFRVFVYSI